MKFYKIKKNIENQKKNQKNDDEIMTKMLLKK